MNDADTQCLKITEKVSFDFASEVSHILSEQNFIKKCQNGQVGKFLMTWLNSVTRQLSFNSIKICYNAKIKKLK